MIRIVIVDDDEDFSEKMEVIIKKFFEEIKEPVFVRRYSEGSALLNELASKRNYDIYFFDVEMPQINGLELAQKVKSTEAEADIVFISAYEKYAVPSYKVRACYYILKEEYKMEIPIILRRIWQERMNGAKDYYAIRNASYGKRIRLDDIVYLTREKKYVLLHCLEGKEYRERGSLEGVYRRLPHDRFVYIDRGYIINLKHVYGWDGDVIKLDNGLELVASRRMNLAFKNALARYWRE